MKVTKSILTLCFLVLIGSFAISCSNANIPDESTGDCEIASGQGELLFNFGSSGAERAAYALDEIQPKVTSYQLVIYNTTNNYNETFSLAAEKKLIMNEGTYNAVILAESGAIAYGSGYAKGILIEANKATTVTFTLKPFDMSLTCSEEVECGKTFEVNYKFDTRNELLAFQQLQVGVNNVTGLDQSISTNNFTGTSYSPGTFNYITCVEGAYTLNAPASTKETYIHLKNAYMTIYDKTYNMNMGSIITSASSPTMPIAPYGVISPYSAINMLSSLKNLTWCPVNFIAPENASTSGLNVNIEWEQ